MDGEGRATFELKPRLAIDTQICLVLLPCTKKKNQARIGVVSKVFEFYIVS